MESPLVAKPTLQNTTSDGHAAIDSEERAQSLERLWIYVEIHLGSGDTLREQDGYTGWASFARLRHEHHSVPRENHFPEQGDVFAVELPVGQFTMSDFFGESAGCEAKAKQDWKESYRHDQSALQIKTSNHCR
jgi:hypothetical protein